jgi:eukaryotic-like serine/threonine-protein kinase
MASSPGERSLLGERYRLKRLLGAGGMASVWLAHDERLGRKVAVKLLSDTLAADDSYLTRFRREARLAAGLSHPNLVGVYDFGGEGERPYLVMEYVEGETLAGRIAGRTARDLDLNRLARELLGALDHIHSAGIVHRDIKPGNVLIAPDGTARVTDFGIAQLEDATRLTGWRFARLLARLGDEDPARRPQSASQALALLGESTAPTARAATATTEPLSNDRTASTVPIGVRTTQTRPDPRVLGGILLAAAVIVLGILLLSGGDESPSPDSRGSGNVQRQTRDQGHQPPAGSAEEPTTTDTASPDTSETPERETAPAKPKKVKPPKPKKVKPPKESKSPPGKAKGLSKP